MWVHLIIMHIIQITVCDGSHRAIDSKYVKSVVPKAGIKGKDK